MTTPTIATARVRGVPGVTVVRCPGDISDYWYSTTRVDGSRIHGLHQVEDVRPLIVLDFSSSPKPKVSTPEAFRIWAGLIQKPWSGMAKWLLWLADEIEVRRKRAGHLLSKGRMMAAQILAMLEDGLWLDNARASNAAAQRLADAAPERLVYPVQANEVFLKVSVDDAARLTSQGFDFYEWGPGQIRLVTSWDQKPDDVDKLAAAIAAL